MWDVIVNHSAVIFDLDGTLTRPYLNFDVIRAELGVEGPVLEAMARMTFDERVRAEAIVRQYERDAAANATLYDGAVDVLDGCRRRGLSVAILTRNARVNVDVVLGNHGIQVDALRTRDDGAIKPSAEPVLSICKEVGADPTRSWMVGDYLFDIQSGREAGCSTVLMIGDQPEPAFAEQADHVIRQLAALLGIIDARA